MVSLKRLRRVANLLGSPLYHQALPKACDSQAAFPRMRSPLAGFEGLLLALMASALFWSALTFPLYRLR